MTKRQETYEVLIKVAAVRRANKGFDFLRRFSRQNSRLYNKTLSRFKKVFPYFIGML